jgi:hypothetical protein
MPLSEKIQGLKDLLNYFYSFSNKGKRIIQGDNIDNNKVSKFIDSNKSHINLMESSNNMESSYNQVGGSGGNNGGQGSSAGGIGSSSNYQGTGGV